jgi:hypothetical protein
MTKEEFLTELFVAVRNHAQKQVEKDHADHWEVQYEGEKIDQKMIQMIWYIAEQAANTEEK